MEEPEEYKALKALGHKVTKPTRALEAITIPQSILEVEFITDEFTAMCPVTGQPDYCTIKIRFMPNGQSIESKSLKLYLMTFRNEGHFNETLAHIIATDIMEVSEAHWVEVECRQKARGGIALNSTSGIVNQHKKEKYHANN